MKLTDTDWLFSGEVTFWKVLYVIFQVLLLIGVLYLALVEVPRLNKIFGDCEKKVLCEHGTLPKEMCIGHDFGKYYDPYYSPNFTFNVTGTTISPV